MHRAAFALALWIAGTCAHAQDAMASRAIALEPDDLTLPPLVNLGKISGANSSALPASVIITLTWDAEGRVTDAQVEPKPRANTLHRELRKWAMQIRLAPGQAGWGYLPLEMAPTMGPAESCDVVVQTTSGQLERRNLPSLRIKSLAAETFALPADAPLNVKMIQCARPSLLPAPADRKVVAAGFPFSVAADKRVVLLTRQDGQLRYKMLSGELSEAETLLMEAYVTRNPD